MAGFPNQVEGVDALILVGYGPAEYPLRGREVDFTKWIGYGLAGLAGLAGLMRRFGLAMDMLSFRSEAEKLILPDGLAVG